MRHGEKKHYNHKVDAYSFAIVLWELLHNKLPFEGMSNLQAAYAAAFKVIIFVKLNIISSWIDFFDNSVSSPLDQLICGTLLGLIIARKFN